MKCLAVKRNFFPINSLFLVIYSFERQFAYGSRYFPYLELSSLTLWQYWQIFTKFGMTLVPLKSIWQN